MPTPFPGWMRYDDSFDFIVVDFPDPTNYSLGKLYTTAFYRAAARHLSEQGMMVVQSTSPMFARRFLLVHRGDAQAGGTADLSLSCLCSIVWRVGFCHCGAPRLQAANLLPAGLRFIDLKGLPALFEFPPDMAPLPMPPNRLNDQVLVRLYDQDWKDISH